MLMGGIAVLYTTTGGGKAIAWSDLQQMVVMTLGLAGLAIGFGTMFPRFETENAAQIPTSLGGLLFMMTSIVMIAGAANPVTAATSTPAAARTQMAAASPRRGGRRKNPPCRLTMDGSYRVGRKLQPTTR